MYFACFHKQKKIVWKSWSVFEMVFLLQHRASIQNSSDIPQDSWQTIITAFCQQGINCSHRGAFKRPYPLKSSSGSTPATKGSASGPRLVVGVAPKSAVAYLIHPAPTTLSQQRPQMADSTYGYGFGAKLRNRG
jgi:hypothetical protein